MITFIHEPEILSFKVSTTNPLWEIGKRSRFAHGITESQYLEEGMVILDGDIFSVAEQISIDFEVKVSERLARQINRHRHMAIVQKSTRYQDCMDSKDFTIYIPPQLNEKQISLWKNIAIEYFENLYSLKEESIPTELLNYNLTLSSMTKVLYHLNLRTLLHMFRVRSCAQALPEFRDLLIKIKDFLCTCSVEWNYIMQVYGNPQCINHSHFSCKNPLLSCKNRSFYQSYASSIKDHLISIREMYQKEPLLLSKWDQLITIYQKKIQRN